VIAINEAFIETLRDQMLNNFAQFGWFSSTKVLKSRQLLNGGILILSKWPVIKQAQIGFSSAATQGSDALVAKGINYAHIRKTLENGQQKDFHIFATHFQAWNSSGSRKCRVLQAIEMKNFVDAQMIEDGPVIFAGDFNVDSYQYPGDLVTLLDNLCAGMPGRLGLEVEAGPRQQFTSDSSNNNLVGRDGAAKDWNCEDLYNSSPYLALNCPCEWLDYIFYSKEYQLPVIMEDNSTPTLECVALKTDPFTVKWNFRGSEERILNDLSDHYPVLARFKFFI